MTNKVKINIYGHSERAFKLNQWKMAGGLFIIISEAGASGKVL